jgi:hypothetical protein
MINCALGKFFDPTLVKKIFNGKNERTSVSEFSRKTLPVHNNHLVINFAELEKMQLNAAEHDLFIRLGRLDTSKKLTQQHRDLQE